MHERSEAIRLGPTWDREWLKRGVTCVEDVDDAITWMPFLQPGGGGFVVGASVYNNHGTDATLIAWLDLNGNGSFDASEAISPITVPSTGTTQNYWLYWPNTTNSFVNGQVTYLRIRVTSASGGMTTSHATGHFTSGEVEDYRVLVDDYPLTTMVVSYTAELWNDKHALLEWKIQEDGSTLGYEVEKSYDGNNWEHLIVLGTDGHPGLKSYRHTDQNIGYGKTFYRLKFIGNNRYSEIRIVNRARLEDIMVIRPNPVRDRALINVNVENRSVAEIYLFTSEGRQLYHQKLIMEPGKSELELPVKTEWPNGTYVLRLFLNHETISRKLIIHR